MRTISCVAATFCAFSFASSIAAAPDGGKTKTLKGGHMRPGYSHHLTKGTGDVSRSVGKDDDYYAKNEARRSGAWQYSYDQASRMWDEGHPNKYECNSFQDVTRAFWLDVQKEVFENCKRQYPFGGKEDGGKEDECKKGAQDFTFGRASECAALSDCFMLGDAAAHGVSALMCPANEKIGKSKKYFFPAVCVDFAVIRCRASAIKGIDVLAKRGDCGNLEDAYDLSFNDLKRIGDQCQKEVGTFAKTIDPL